MNAKQPNLKLSIAQPDGRVTEVTPEHESFILGSGPGAGIRVEDGRVSSLHLMLKVSAGEILALDLCSEDGTYLDGHRLQGPTALRSGAELRLGGTRLRVEALVPAPRVAPSLADQLANSVEALYHSPVEAASPAPPRPEKIPAPPSLRPEPVRPAAHLRAVESPAQPERLASADFEPAAGLASQFAPATAASAKPSVESRALPKRAAWRARRPAFFAAPLSADARPTPQNKILQVSMVWGDTVLGIQHFADGQSVTIGDSARCSFQIRSALVKGRFTLARPGEKAFWVQVPRGAELTVDLEGKKRDAQTLRDEKRLQRAPSGEAGELFSLGLHERAEVELDDVTLVLRYVPASAALPAGKWDPSDTGFLKIASASLALLAVFALTMWLKPTEAPVANSGNLFKANDKVVQLLLKPPPKKKPSFMKQKQGVEEGAKAKDKEGEFGKQEAKKDEADPSKKGSPVVDSRKKEQDRKKVLTSGLLGALGGKAASNVFGPGGLGTGINNALGGLKSGAGAGDASGIGGLGSRGTGTGGGGTGLGLGGLGTKGTGRGAGGYGDIDLNGKGKEATRIVPGKTTVVGGLSKDEIMRVIRRHQSEIKFCYERELQKSPNLAGKVAVAFTIDPAGGVAEANVTDSSLSNNNTESCMISQIRGWKFPQPEGGGVVAVTFPWIFKPAGSESGEG